MTGLLGSSHHLGDRASELLDGRLTGSQELQARQHLGGCRDCAAAVHREQQVRAALRSAGAGPALRGHLMVGLMALAASDAAPPIPVLSPRRSSVRRTAAVLGTVSLAGAGVLGVAALAGPSWLPQPTPASVAGSGSTGHRPASSTEGDLGTGGLSTTTVSTAVRPGLLVVTGAFHGGTPLRGTDAAFQQGP